MDFEENNGKKKNYGMDLFNYKYIIGLSNLYHFYLRFYFNESHWLNNNREIINSNYQL